MAGPTVTFETPENVQVSYEPAGLGTRFIAWFIDSTLLSILLFVIFIAVVAAGILSNEAADFIGGLLGEVFEEALEDGGEVSSYEAGPVFQMVMWGLFSIIMGFSSFLYFGLFEYMMDGRTPGKKWLRIRVVKDRGFTLDAGSIFLRNIFRIVDQITLLWIVPVISPKTQRLGDMVGGTLVVRDKPRKLSRVREELLVRPQHAIRFPQDGTRLSRLDDKVLDAAEQFLDRYEDLSETQQEELAVRLAATMAQRMGVDQPERSMALVFLVDTLAQVFRRRARKLE
ncbi:MAG: RDD family protein [Oceanidesulfovibrio sp.]